MKASTLREIALPKGEEGAICEGFTYIDPSQTKGLDRRTIQVRGRTEGRTARLSSTFFVIDDEQIGVARVYADGLILRVSTRDGTLQELRFRCVTTGQVNAAIQRMTAQCEKAHASWALAWKRYDIVERYNENRQALANGIENIRRLESRLDSFTIATDAAQANLRIVHGRRTRLHSKRERLRVLGLRNSRRPNWSTPRRLRTIE